MKRLYLSIFLTFTTFATVAHSENSVDASKFDIAAVQLGMTMDEAISGLKNSLSLTEIPLGTKSFMNQITGELDHRSIRVEDNLYSVSVVLVPNVPPYSDGDTMVVESILYEQPRTPENIKVMADAAVAKYGSPTVQTFLGLSVEWCEKTKVQRCDGDSGAILALIDTQLTLSDAGFRKAYLEYVAKQKTSAPKF